MTSNNGSMDVEGCPDDLSLEELVAGTCNSHEEGTLSEHIGRCSVCQQRLESLDTTRLSEILPVLDRKQAQSNKLRFAIQKSQNRDMSAANNKSEDKIPAESDAKEAGIESLPYFDILKNDGLELVATLGQGGMGIVYKARQSSLNRYVAVKVLAPKLNRDESARSRFLREAQAASAVNHPSVITIHAVGHNAKYPYLVMEFIDGNSLREKISTGMRFSTQSIAKIGRQICGALEAAHKKGIVHRDVKPANVLIDKESGRILLGDFGLAREIEQPRITQANMVTGTPEFVAPEILKGKGDHRSDLFSLGVLLYELCSGRSPFRADTVLATINNVGSQAHEPLDTNVVPDELARVVDKLLVKDPNKRFQSAAEVKAALKIATEEHGVAIHSNMFSLDRKQLYNHRLFFITIPLIAFSLLLFAIYQLGSVQNRLVFSDATILDARAGGESPKDNDERDTTARKISDANSGMGGVFNCFNDEGELRGRYHSLADAIFASREGDVIEINYSGELEINEAIQLDNSIVISPADGYDPILVFDPDEDQNLDSLFYVSGNASIVRLQLQTTKEMVSECSLIEVRPEGVLELFRCNLVQKSQNGPACVVAEGELNLEECRIHAPHSAAFNLKLDANKTVSLTQCQVSGEIGFDVSLADHAVLRMEASSLFCQGIFRLLASDDQSHLFLDVSSSLLCVAGDSVFVGVANHEQIDKNFRWAGSANVFSGPLLSNGVGNQKLSGFTVENDYQNWFDNVGERESRFVVKAFETDAERMLNSSKEDDFLLSDFQTLPGIKAGFSNEAP